MTLSIFNHDTDTNHENILNASYDFRRLVLGETTFTPKFFQLLQDIGNQFTDDCLLTKRIKDLKTSCAGYKKSCQQALAPCIDTAQLQMSSNLYALIDDITLASSIQDRLAAWHLVSTLFEAQAQGLAPYKLTITPKTIPVEYDYVNRTSGEYQDELLDYAELLQAWLDIYFDEYDEYADDDIMTDIVSIIVDLEYLAKALAESYPDSSN